MSLNHCDSRQRMARWTFQVWVPHSTMVFQPSWVTQRLSIWLAARGENGWGYTSVRISLGLARVVAADQLLRFGYLPLHGRHSFLLCLKRGADVGLDSFVR